MLVPAPPAPVRSARASLLALSPLFLAACAPDSPDLPAPLLVPEPVLVEAGAGSFLLDEDTEIQVEGGGDAIATLLAADLRPATGLPLEIGPVQDAARNAIVITLDPSLDLPAEGYTLDVDPDGAYLAASDRAGLFYATQTLRQLLPPESVSASRVRDVDWQMPSVHIEDAPRFRWRGLMIDVARHFFDVTEIERQIDVMALHKMNRLHLHLTDDQGWRIEIPGWPLLTEIGGSTEVGGGEGGWYTLADYAALVAYADARCVTLVPEVDFPGHANAALASYAELNESGTTTALYTGAPVISTPLWLDGPATAGFVEDVWHELATNTPGPWVHVGGDEAVGIDADEYDTFVGGLQDTVTAEDRTLVGWDELGTVPLDAPFVAQHWYHEDDARDAVDQGGSLIASPAEHTYLDMVHDTSAFFGQTWAGAINVEKAYDWNPVPLGMDEADVLGVEGALWTEYITSRERMDFMVWPRLAAHAELGWTAAETTDWDSFRERLAADGVRLDTLGIRFYHSPEIDWVE